jgi:hypothetical protein
MNTISSSQPFAADRQQFEELHPYRAVNRTAILVLVLGFFSLLALLFPTLLFLPLAGTVLGLMAISKIRRYPHEFTGMAPAKIGMALCLVLFLAGASRHTYIYLTEVPDGYQRISFVEFQPDRQQPHSLVPESIQQLDGHKVFIKGYVHPGVSGQGDVKTFVLVPDMGTCCFGGQPKLTDMVEVTLRDPNRIRYSTHKRNLGGVLKVSDQVRSVSGGLQGGIYQLDADYVK